MRITINIPPAEEGRVLYALQEHLLTEDRPTRAELKQFLISHINNMVRHSERAIRLRTAEDHHEDPGLT